MMREQDPVCPDCHHRQHVHSSPGSHTPGCRVIGCGCPRIADEVG